MDKPYAILSIPFLCLMVYLATWLAAKIGAIPKDLHRRFWNVLLLIAFFGTAGLGFLLAIQVNFKLNLRAVDSVMTWHVDFGIGLLAIALIHFSGHLKYYANLFSGRKITLTGKLPDNETELAEPGGTMPHSRMVRILIPFCLGLTALATQIILLREFLSLYQGNELSIGIVLSDWMLLTGLGAWLGKKTIYGSKSRFFILQGLLALSLLTLVTLFAADLLKAMLYPTGAIVGISGIFFSTLLLLVPFCIFSGFLFTRIAGYLSESQESNSAAIVYANESLGSFAGGVLVNFILVFIFKPFQSATIIFILNAAILAVIAFRLKYRALFRVLIPAVVLIPAAIILINPDMLSRRLFFPHQEIEYYRNTPYGTLLVTRSEEQRNFFGNNTLLFTTNDITTNEESVHYALLQRPNPRNVLLVEGGVSGSLKEILKYPVERAYYVESNPWILRLGQKYTRELNDRRISLIRGDIRPFLQRDTVLFDAVLLQVPEPLSLMANRYYTLEFFRLVKSRMNAGAVCSLGLMPTPDYVGEEAKAVQSVVLSTLRQVFPFVVVIPGEKNYFLASDQPLDINVAGLSSARLIPTEYVNQYYIDDLQVRERSGQIMKVLSEQAEINRDFKPLAFFGQIRYWLSYFGKPTSIYWPLLALLLFLIFRAVKTDPVNTGLMSTGFTASSHEILLLFVYQVLYGNLYLMAGIIILTFMLGLCLGASAGIRIFKQVRYRRLISFQYAMAIISLVIFAVLFMIRTWELSPLLVHGLILLLILLSSITAGMQYQASSRVIADSPAAVSASLYSADLLGSAAGSLIVSVLLTPVLGMDNTLLALCLLNLLTAGWMYFRRNRVTLSYS